MGTEARQHWLHFVESSPEQMPAFLQTQGWALVGAPGCGAGQCPAGQPRVTPEAFRPGCVWSLAF